MKWTNYPTDKDRRDRTNGTDVTGQFWSEAPGPGNKWCVPDGVRKAVLVTQRAGSNMGAPFSVGPLADVVPPPAEVAADATT